MSIITLFASEIVDTIPLKDQSVGKLLLGYELSLRLLFASWVMAMIGFISILLIDLQIVIIKNFKQGFKFSISYWYQDNGARVITDFLLSFFILFAIMRFHGKYSDQELTMWMPFSVGASIDAVILIVRRFTNFNGFNGVNNNNQVENTQK